MNKKLLQLINKRRGKIKPIDNMTVAEVNFQPFKPLSSLMLDSKAIRSESF